ncbi:site-specific integrase [Nonomuraea sp. NPDC049421]|uniref:tyrosine-type recombinase/integrase n=1 Tax=Nonomuraea sp. NPDC049421 TaxID=3155275 RepID=UPI0034163ADA
MQPKLRPFRARATCKPGCAKPGHVCYKRPCLKDCAGHAEKCPKRTGGGLVFRQRKGKSKLTLQCPPELLAQLKAHREIQDAEREKAGDRWEDHDLVFATKHGKSIERTEDWKRWKAVLKQAGVRDVRVHDARHTAATLLIEQGVNIRVVQQVLGHTRVTTTERTPTYPHP